MIATSMLLLVVPKRRKPREDWLPAWGFEVDPTPPGSGPADGHGECPL